MSFNQILLDYFEPIGSIMFGAFLNDMYKIKG